MTEQDFNDSKQLLDTLVGESFQYSLATNSIKLHFFSEGCDRGIQYIWIDPPWRIYRRGSLEFSSDTYPTERGAAEDNWFKNCPIPVPAKLLSYRHEEDGSFCFMFSEDYDLILPHFPTERNCDDWYDHWYVSEKRGT